VPPESPDKRKPTIAALIRQGFPDDVPNPELGLAQLRLNLRRSRSPNRQLMTKALAIVAFVTVTAADWWSTPLH